MAIGISLMLNIKLPVNFNSPYKSSSIIIFWRNWHITLSSFLKNYLYIPLGGNKFGVLNRYKNLFLTMFLGGVWHGANLTFIIWGSLHGFYLIINHLWENLSKDKFNLLKENIFYKILMISITFFSITLAWIFFRSDDMATSLNMLKGCFGYYGINLPSTLEIYISSFINTYGSISFQGVFINIPGLASVGGIVPFLYKIFFCFTIVWFFPNSQEILKYQEDYKKEDKHIFYISNLKNIIFGIILGLLFCLSFGNIEKLSPFLYYQF